jgi:hypothetical protein
MNYVRVIRKIKTYVFGRNIIFLLSQAALRPILWTIFIRRELHEEKVNDLLFSPNIFRVIKSRIIWLAGHVARYGGEERRLQGLGGEIWRKEPAWETQT